MKERKYTITCTEEQLRLIANAVEDWHRFLAGQCELSNATSMLENYHKLYEVLNNDVRPLVVPELSGRGASYGWSGSTCPNKYQRKAIAMSYGIYRQILHFFALKRKTEGEGNDWNVYNSETLTCKEQGGLITIKEVEQ